jgi:hypothetical protein
MSALTEQEVLTKHAQSLKEGGDACLALARNADPEYLAPRGHLYAKLKKALTELEGTCRQMSAYRDDARWLKLGFLYARAMRTAQAKFVSQNWLAFRQLSELFTQGLSHMDDLANRKTGATGMILPKRYDWLILPDHKPPMPGLAARLRSTVH